MPIARMPAARLHCVMMASGMAVAKIRTQSARARVSRNTPDAVAEEVVARVALAARQHEAEHDHGDAVRRDDGDVEGSHQDRSTKSPRRARAWNADQKGANGLTP